MDIMEGHCIHGYPCISWKINVSPPISMISIDIHTSTDRYEALTTFKNTQHIYYIYIYIYIYILDFFTNARKSCPILIPPAILHAVQTITLLFFFFVSQPLILTGHQCKSNEPLPPKVGRMQIMSQK